MGWVVDTVIVVILLGSVVSGLRSGLAATLGGLLGLAAGAIASVWALPQVAGAVDPPWRTAAVLGALAVLLTIGLALGISAGSLVRSGADRLHLRVVERLLGGGLGLVVGLVVVSLGGASIASAGIHGVSPAVASSTVLRMIDDATPAPVSDALARAQARWVGRIPMPAIDAPRGLAVTDPQTSRPVDLADPDLARAAQSVARVRGPARGCGSVSTGSGFVIAPDRILTNAHVVAGVEDPMVELPGEPAREGRVVYFDPHDDLAVIAADVDADPLPLADTLPRGASAVVQGYPHGGAFRSVPATVQAAGSGEIVDPTIKETVQREMYVLSTDVEPGNSGGPLLTTDGEVAGVVFARGSTDHDTAYAMTNAEVLPVLAQLDEARDTVSTGSCSR